MSRSAKQKETATLPGSYVGFHPSRISKVLKCAGYIGQPLTSFFFSISFFGQSTDWSLKHCECPEKCREMVAFILFPFWRSFNQHSNFHFMIINTGLPYDPGITLLGLYPEKTNSKRYMLPYLHSSTIHNSQEVEAN